MFCVRIKHSLHPLGNEAILLALLKAVTAIGHARFRQHSNTLALTVILPEFGRSGAAISITSLTTHFD